MDGRRDSRTCARRRANSPRDLLSVYDGTGSDLIAQAARAYFVGNRNFASWGIR
jgi:hypothetical protein